MCEKVLDFDTEEEQEFYQGIQGKLVRRWKALESDNSLLRLALIMKLRQLSVHPAVYVNARKKHPLGYARDYTGGSTKFNALLKMMEDVPSGKKTKWIVFCQFREEMELLQEFLEASPAIARVQQYHGGVPDAMKEKVLEATKNAVNGHDVLLLQLQSGGVGLNLQHFTKIVFMSPWWTAALMDQAVGRAVRIGQTEVVEVTRLVLKEEETMNIDRMMLEKVEDKRSQLEIMFTHASDGVRCAAAYAAVAPAAAAPAAAAPAAAPACDPARAAMIARIEEIEARLAQMHAVKGVQQPQEEVEVLEDPQN
jgi:SNF2 family DNA or RNA helicase